MMIPMFPAFVAFRPEFNPLCHARFCPTRWGQLSHHARRVRHAPPFSCPGAHVPCFLPCNRVIEAVCTRLAELAARAQPSVVTGSGSLQTSARARRRGRGPMMNFAHPRAALELSCAVPFTPYPSPPTMQLGTAEHRPQSLSVASRLAALQLQTAALQIELEAQSAADALSATFHAMPATLPPPFFPQLFHGELSGPAPAGLRVNLPVHMDHTSAAVLACPSDPRQLLPLRSSLPSSVADSPYALSSISSPVSQACWQNPAQDPLAVAVAEVAAAAAAAAAAERRSRSSLSMTRASPRAAPAGEHAFGAVQRSTLDSALRSAVVAAVTPAAPTEARGAAALVAAERTAAAGVGPAAASANASGAQLKARG
jgi:hypothetical protein